MNNIGFKILFVISAVFALADLGFTLWNKPLIEFAEVNPLYHFGGLGLIILVNILFWIILYIWYHKTNSMELRYMFCFIFVLISIMRIPIIMDHIDVHEAYEENPTAMMIRAEEIYINEVQKVETQQQKVLFQEDIMRLLMSVVMPTLTVVFTYIFFSQDHIIKKKEEENAEDIIREVETSPPRK